MNKEERQIKLAAFCPNLDCDGNCAYQSHTKKTQVQDIEISQRGADALIDILPEKELGEFVAGCAEIYGKYPDTVNKKTGVHESDPRYEPALQQFLKTFFIYLPHLKSYKLKPNQPIQ